ncbi:MAG: histidinol-phosphatase [Clostridia bacterium]|nr:histidinol-phosphatase [Clostridia bacterium]MBR3714338.1 histidinol-phosphatase [Clostridia bacterium]
MLSNYHIHTARCHHATGTEEEYVLRAIERGLKTIGFSDHTPYFYDGDYVSPAKMSISEMPDYFNTLLYLRKKYKEEIDIKIGFETEYFPKFFDRLIEEYRKFPLDYVILGQHIVGNESTDDMINSFLPTSEGKYLTRFVDQCTEALETGRFTYFAHPDCFNFVPKGREDEELAEFEYERLIRAAMRTETPIEINLCGVRCGRYYPNPRFWKIAGKLGAKTVIGCDAHAPEQVADSGEIKIAMRLVNDNSLNLIEDFPLKNPCI